MIETPKVVEYPGQSHAAVIHLTVPRDAIQAEMGPAIHQVLAVLAEQNISPTGPLFSHHLTQSIETFDFEVGFPVNEAIMETTTGGADGGRRVVKNSSLPSGTMAYTCHVGPYEELHSAWEAFEEWTRASDGAKALVNFQTGATLFEIYTLGPETTSDPKEYRTEMYQTLKKA